MSPADTRQRIARAVGGGAARTGAALAPLARALSASPLARLARCRRGSAAVEFGFIAVLFLGILFLVLNTALIFFAQQTLQTATTQAARLIMTGQAQAESMSVAQFQQQVCTNAGSLFDCSGLYVNVQTFNSFSSISNSLTNPVKNGQFSSANLGFTLGNSGAIQVVQVFYQWPVFATLLGYDVSNIGAGLSLLVATAAFRNEPYPGAAP
jgi:Flp pilus assembly protein TadG